MKLLSLIKKNPKLRAIVIAVFFILLFNALGISLFLVKKQQDLRQRAGGNLVKAHIYVAQAGNLLNDAEMANLRNSVGSLVYAATKTDVSYDISTGPNYQPPALSSDEFSKLRNDQRFKQIPDDKLVYWKYYDDYSANVDFHWGLVNSNFSGQGYNLVIIFSNFQSSYYAGYAHMYQTGKYIIITNPSYAPPYTQKQIAPISGIQGTVVHEIGHALGANHPCNRCYTKAVDGNSDNPYSDGSNPNDWNETKRKECCSLCQWKDDIMSYCTGHVTDFSKAYSACSIRRMESTQYSGGSGGNDCNEGTEYVLGSNIISPTPIPSNTDCKLPKEACLKASEYGCFWYKGYKEQFPECRKGEAGVACGTEANCYAPDSTSNQVCYFDVYCANHGDLGFDAPCENSDQCLSGSTCKGNPLTCVKDIPDPTSTPDPNENNTCKSDGYLTYQCASKSAGGCSSISANWTESTSSGKSCGNDNQVCCWDKGPVSTAPSCNEKYPGSVCRSFTNCQSGYEIHDTKGTTCENEYGGLSLCCGPKVDYGTEYNCLDKNCEAPTYTCVGSSNGNEVGSFCLVKGTGGPNAYCGLPDGKGANNDSCGSGYCNPATLRCATKPTSPPLPPAPPPPPTATPTPAAPAIPSVSAATCVNGDPGTLVFSWSREKSGYNYEIRWGTNYSESASVGDRSDSDPISGFSTNASLDYEVRSYLGNNIGPYKTGSVYIPSTCSTAGTSCTGGINNCANSDGSNYSCSGTKSYLGNGTMDSWCKNNGGAGSREYCWKCTSITPLVCDFNKNGSYDDGDISTWTTAYNTGNNTADCNGDGKSNIFDYNLWLEKSTQ